MVKRKKLPRGVVHALPFPADSPKPGDWIGDPALDSRCIVLPGAQGASDWPDDPSIPFDQCVLQCAATWAALGREPHCHKAKRANLCLNRK